MANRSFLPPEGHLEARVVKLYGTMTVGASGAVSSSSGKGIASVVHDSTGKYTVTLTDSYQSLLHHSVSLLDDTDSDPTTVGVLVRGSAEDVDNATPTFTFQFYDTTDGGAADPASGAVVTWELTLKNSTI